MLCGGEHLTHDLADLPSLLRGCHFDGMIGGPPCQALSKTRAMRKPKFPDLTPLVRGLLGAVSCEWFLFENVSRLDIPGARHARLDAMHYHQPHQSRPRWFTHSPSIQAPPPKFRGTIDDLLAYPAVAARIYGPKRGAVLQGYPDFARLKVPSVDLQLGLANAVPYHLGSAWAQQCLLACPPDEQLCLPGVA